MSAVPAALKAAAETVGSPSLNITIFVLFVLFTLAIVVRASRHNRSAADYYAGGHRACAGHGLRLVSSRCLSRSDCGSKRCRAQRR